MRSRIFVLLGVLLAAGLGPAAVAKPVRTQPPFGGAVEGRQSCNGSVTATCTAVASPDSGTLTTRVDVAPVGGSAEAVAGFVLSQPIQTDVKPLHYMAIVHVDDEAGDDPIHSDSYLRLHFESNGWVFVPSDSCLDRNGDVVLEYRDTFTGPLTFGVEAVSHADGEASGYQCVDIACTTYSVPGPASTHMSAVVKELSVDRGPSRCSRG